MIANMLTQLKNAQMRGRTEVDLPYSKMDFAVLEILKSKGFIAELDKKKKKAKKVELPYIWAKLQYKDGVGAINGLKLVSKSSRRMYAGKSELKPVKSGYGMAIISTSKGVMAGEDARKAGLGGEVLFEIW